MSSCWFDDLVIDGLVTFNGVPVNGSSPVYDQAAFFENGLSANIGIDEGVILATGDALDGA